MPELPDITIYIEALEERILGQQLNVVLIKNLFLLRTYKPPIEETFQQKVVEIKRLGKRIAIGLDNELWLVIHLMIAGRLQWKDEIANPPGKIGLASFQFDRGSLLLTEAGSKKRASLHVVTSEDLLDHEPGGIDVMTATLEEFTQSLTLTNRTVKRQLTSPMLFSGIGNAYSDEILHRAGISPIQHTQKMTEQQIADLYRATQEVMQEWIDLLRKQAKGKFPKKVTAFRPEMAVHGKYKEPCPVCGAPVQRIVYAENETNYCAQCQNGGRILADRSLSRLLKDDWPRSLDHES